MGDEKLHPAMFLLVNQIRQSCGFSTADENDLRQWGELDAAVVAQGELMAEGVRAYAAAEQETLNRRSGSLSTRRREEALSRVVGARNFADRLEHNEGDRE